MMYRLIGNIPQEELYAIVIVHYLRVKWYSELQDMWLVVVMQG